jgi:hypothetical protein
MLKEKIARRESGLLFYGLTPPRAGIEEEKVRRAAERLAERIKGAPLDGLVLYDIQDEPGRSGDERPFAFMPTIDPYEYARSKLSSISVPKIIYRAAGKHDAEGIVALATGLCDQDGAVVLVGSPKGHGPGLTLEQAYAAWTEVSPPIPLGGVAIPERHSKKGGEDKRLIAKEDAGCSFFITQCVYRADAAMSLASDYARSSAEIGRMPRPLIFTLTPAGDAKTIRFMRWLGIDVPEWLEREYQWRSDGLALSVSHCVRVASNLKGFCQERGIPYGFNIESVSIRKEEISASIDLLHKLAEIV